MPDEIVTLGELFTHTGFMSGLAAGLAVLGLFYLASLVTKRSISGWGLAFAGTVIAVLALQFVVAASLFFNLGLLVLGGWFLDVANSVDASFRAKVVKTFGWVILTAATLWLVTTDDFPDEAWAIVGFPLVVLAIGTAVRRLNRPPISEILGLMFAVSVFGIWVTVPETDMLRVLLGVSIPLALATLPLIQARVTGAGAFALVGLIAWLTVGGGAARPASIIGGWAAFGLLPLIPLLGLHRRSPGKVAILGIHVVFVVLASRVVGSWESVIAASIGVTVLLISFVMVLKFVLMRPDAATTTQSEKEVRSL